MAKFQNPEGVSASSADAQNLKFERADWTSFRTLEGLQQKAGVALDGLVALVLKELADNALDTGAKVTVGEIAGGYFIEDDGPGIDPDEVARLFSIARPLTSSKMLRLPTRGALGNGLRVAAGAVLASGGKLSVETRGVSFTLKPRHQDGTTASTRRAAQATSGNASRDQLRRVPAERSSRSQPDAKAPLDWPRAAFPTTGSHRPTGTTAPQFHELLSASGDAPVRALVASLDGCAGGRAGEIVMAAGLGRKTCRQVDAAGAVRLLRAARAVAKPVSPKRLGAIGPGQFPGCAHAVADGEVRFGSEPQALIPVRGRGLDEAKLGQPSRSLRQPDAGHGSRDAAEKTRAISTSSAAALRTISPRPPTSTSRSISMSPRPTCRSLRTARSRTSSRSCPRLATPPARRSRRWADRRASHRRRRMSSSPTSPEAINEVSEGGKYRFNERNLFYRLRPIVQEEIGQELKISNFKIDHRRLRERERRDQADVPRSARQPRPSAPR